MKHCSMTALIRKVSGRGDSTCHDRDTLGHMLECTLERTLRTAEQLLTSVNLHL